MNIKISLTFIENGVLFSRNGATKYYKDPYEAVESERRFIEEERDRRNQMRAESARYKIESGNQRYMEAQRHE